MGSRFKFALGNIGLLSGRGTHSLAGKAISSVVDLSQRFNLIRRSFCRNDIRT